MAKRKRLDLSTFTTAPSAPEPGGFREAAPLPPIAGVAGEAAVAAAAGEALEAMETARREGRMVMRLKISDIDMRHLQRDRIPPEAWDEDMAALVASLRQHGQRTPVEVVETAPGRYGLISGWRRMTALSEIHGEDAEIMAILRPVGSDRDAYVAMVEENEVRANLSFYERARVAQLATSAGAFGHVDDAVDMLFASASKSKRSKIRSFVRVVEAFDDVLRFPAHLPERLGLKLAQALKEGRRWELIQAVERLDREQRSVVDEAEALEAVLATAPPKASKGPAKPAAGSDWRLIAPGIGLEIAGRGKSRRIVLSGEGISDRLVEEIEAFLAGRR